MIWSVWLTQVSLCIQVSRQNNKDKIIRVSVRNLLEKGVVH